MSRLQNSHYYNQYRAKSDAQYEDIWNQDSGFREPPTDYHQIEMNKIITESSNDRSDRESLDSKGHRKSFTRLMVRFAEKTSMVGVGYINSARFWYAKAIWAFLLLTAIGWSIFHLFYLIDQFFGWPKQTKISLGFSSLAFPAVTICNTNVIKNSKLHLASLKLQGLVSLADPSRLRPQDNIPTTEDPIGNGRRKKRFVNNLKNQNFNNFTGVNRDYYDDPETQYQDYNVGTKNDLYELENTFRRLYNEEDRLIRMEMGHQIEDMLLSCSFNGYSCFPENFTSMNTEDYGNCYTLQSKKFITKDPGPKKGLSLILYTENNEFLTGINQGYGARLLIHNQNSFPMPAEHGIFISSSFETHIGLKMTNITRIGQPHGKCETGTTFKSAYKLEYSRTTCQLVCEQSTMLQQCGCYSDDNKEFFYFIADARRNSWCKTNTDFKCIGKIKRQFDRNERKCNCLNPCKEVQYTLSLSSRQWPTTEYTNTLLTGLCEQFPNKCERVYNLKGDPRELSANFMKVTIYYEDLNYEELTEEEEIQFAQFISDVGGSVGLWVGLSVLSLFEVVQLFIELCVYAGHRCSRGTSKNSSKDKKYKTEEKKTDNDKHVLDYNNSYRANWNNRY